MSFYKTNNPAAIKAFEEYRIEAKALRDRCVAFAESFGGKAALYGDPLRMGGIQFDGPADPALWICPAKNDVYQPRRKPRKGDGPDVKAKIKANVERWTAGLPLKTVDFDPVYKALGYNNSLDFIFCGMRMVFHDGWIYAKTSAAMPTMTEILGSEFNAVEVAIAAAKAKAVQP